MKQKPAGRPSSSEQIIRDIKRRTRKQYSAEEKIRIVVGHKNSIGVVRLPIGTHGAVRQEPVLIRDA